MCYMLGTVIPYLWFRKITDDKMEGPDWQAEEQK